MHPGREHGNTEPMVKGADKLPLPDIFQPTETTEGICPDTPRMPRANATFCSLSNGEMAVVEVS